MEKKKGLQVKIHMSTTINDRGKIEKNTFSAIGQVFHKGTSTYIMFDEPSQTDQVTKQTVRIQEDRFTVIRNGAISMNQQFIEGKETEGTFRAPYGVFAMRTKTKQLSFQWDEQRGEGVAKLRYTLQLQNEHAGEYDLKLTLKEVKNR